MPRHTTYGASRARETTFTPFQTMKVKQQPTPPIKNLTTTDQFFAIFVFTYFLFCLIDFLPPHLAVRVEPKRQRLPARPDDHGVTVPARHPHRGKSREGLHEGRLSSVGAVTSDALSDAAGEQLSPGLETKSNHAGGVIIASEIELVRTPSQRPGKLTVEWRHCGEIRTRNDFRWYAELEATMCFHPAGAGKTGKTAE